MYRKGMPLNNSFEPIRFGADLQPSDVTRMAKYLNDRAEYARPWKLVALAFGIAFLIAGALWSGPPDWDMPISLIMALPAYLTAPCSLRVLLERRRGQSYIALFWTWFSVAIPFRARA